MPKRAQAIKPASARHPAPCHSCQLQLLKSINLLQALIIIILKTQPLPSPLPPSHQPTIATPTRSSVSIAPAHSNAMAKSKKELSQSTQAPQTDDDDRKFDNTHPPHILVVINHSSLTSGPNLILLLSRPTLVHRYPVTLPPTVDVPTTEDGKGKLILSLIKQCLNVKVRPRLAQPLSLIFPALALPSSLSFAIEPRAVLRILSFFPSPPPSSALGLSSTFLLKADPVLILSPLFP